MNSLSSDIFFSTPNGDQTNIFEGPSPLHPSQFSRCNEDVRSSNVFRSETEQQIWNTTQQLGNSSDLSPPIFPNQPSPPSTEKQADILNFRSQYDQPRIHQPPVQYFHIEQTQNQDSARLINNPTENYGNPTLSSYCRPISLPEDIEASLSNYSFHTQAPNFVFPQKNFLVSPLSHQHQQFNTSAPILPTCTKEYMKVTTSSETHEYAPSCNSMLKTNAAGIDSRIDWHHLSTLPKNTAHFDRQMTAAAHTNARQQSEHLEMVKFHPNHYLNSAVTQHLHRIQTDMVSNQCPVITTNQTVFNSMQNSWVHHQWQSSVTDENLCPRTNSSSGRKSSRRRSKQLGVSHRLSQPSLSSGSSINTLRMLQTQGIHRNPTEILDIAYGINIVQKHLPSIPNGGASVWLSKLTVTSPFRCCLVYRGTTLAPEWSMSYGKIQLTLKDVKIWNEMHVMGSEMIATLSGRRIFPSLSLEVEGLCPTDNYLILMDLVLVQPYAFKHQAGQWVPNAQLKEISQPVTMTSNVYLHENSPKSGAYWMQTGVNFTRAKITNSKQEEHLPINVMKVTSMHQYLPRFCILRMPSISLTDSMQMATMSVTYSMLNHAQLVGTYVIPGTEFYAVTAYQNPDVIRIKVKYNPFAKGFRNRQESDLEVAAFTRLSYREERNNNAIGQRRHDEDDFI